MKLLIDTNVYPVFFRGDLQVQIIVQMATDIVMPFIVLAELRAGFLLGTRHLRNEQILSQFITEEHVDILFADSQTTHHYARLNQQLRQQGTPIPINDLWIAALSIQHNLTLYSKDKHFDHLPQLPRIQ